MWSPRNTRLGLVIAVLFLLLLVSSASRGSSASSTQSAVQTGSALSNEWHGVLTAFREVHQAEQSGASGQSIDNLTSELNSVILQLTDANNTSTPLDASVMTRLNSTSAGVQSRALELADASSFASFRLEILAYGMVIPASLGLAYLVDGAVSKTNTRRERRVFSMIAKLGEEAPTGEN